MSHQLVADVDDGGDRITYRDAVYACVPGFRPLMLDLVVPRAPAPIAVVLYLHGGGFTAGTHKTTRDLLGRQVTTVLTARGIAVASVGYRLTGEACFPAPVHDVKAAVRWLRRHAHELNIDPARVGAWGGSAGAPLLLVHGTADDGVPISQSEELLAAYQRAGSAVTLTRVTGADHGFTNVDREGLLQASAAFLARHLNAGCPARGITNADGRSGAMPVFTPGLALARAFYADVVAPLVEVPHTACLLGEGSEVLGYDSPRSVDHEWGPRVQLFVAADQVGRVRDTIAGGLPPDYGGWPTAWYSLAHDAVTHHIEVTTFDEWIVTQLGVDPRHELDEATWLGLSQQRLLQLTRGGVFRDDAGELTRVRRLLAWYPRDVWRWLLASQWRLIGTAEPLLGRTMELGDQRGARLLVATLCRLIMEMAFLQERRYRPYDKWLGAAFAELDVAGVLGPLIDAALHHPPASAVDSPLSRALLTLGHHHTALAITKPVTPVIGEFQVNINDAVRPYPVLNTADFVTATTEAITNPELRQLVAVGGIDQLTHASDTLINFTSWPTHLTQIYRSLLRPG